MRRLKELRQRISEQVATFVHGFRLRFSSAYRSELLAAKFKKFGEDVAQLSRLDGLEAKRALDAVKAETASFAGQQYPSGTYEMAVQMLVDADAFAANELGISLSKDKRAAAQKCADKILDTARAHMKLYGHGDRAHWAGKRIALAHKWLTSVGVMTRELETELRAYAEKLTWAHRLFDPNIDYWQYHRQHLLR